jgi:SprT-like family protein
MPKPRANPARRPGYYVVEGLDLHAEMERLCRLQAMGGEDGPLARRLPRLAVRRAASRPRTRLGFAVPAEWRISVTAHPGARPGDLQETLLHELVHLLIGLPRGRRRWHGPEFKAALRRAMREAYGIHARPANSYHGTYAEALERRRSARRAVHPHQLALDLPG